MSSVRGLKPPFQWGRAEELEFTRRLAGEARQFKARFAPIREDDAVRGVLAIVSDITGLKQALEAAERANKAKSAFLAHMSHEIRTPDGRDSGRCQNHEHESRSLQTPNRWISSSNPENSFGESSTTSCNCRALRPAASKSRPSLFRSRNCFGT